MTEVGDKVLVMPSFGENVAIPLGGIEVEDRVILYNLEDETRIAVPTLNFGIGDHVFNTPSFEFAGFNFHIDFNFQLIPLILGLWMKFKDHDLKVVMPSGTFYGDDIVHFKKYTDDTQYGDIEFSLINDPGLVPGEGAQNDLSICLRGSLTSIEIWVCAGRDYDYGSTDSAAVYLFNSLVWEGSLAPAINHPKYIHYHNANWLP